MTLRFLLLAVPVGREVSDHRHCATLPQTRAWIAGVPTGVDGLRIPGLPGDRVMAAMKKYGRIK